MEDIKQILHETAEELSNISLITKEGKQVFVREFLKTFDTHYKLIDYIENDADEILEIRKIKKSKTHLKKYISAFEQNLQLYTIIEDEPNRDKMILNIWLFELFIKNVKEFFKFQSYIFTFFLANPETLEIYKNLVAKTKPLSDNELMFKIKYERNRYLKSLLKFFRCHSLTRKNIMTSLSITLYKALIKTDAISKYQIKEILETMFYKLDTPTTIRVDEMDNAYIKTVVNGVLIYAYPSSNDIESLYNFEETHAKLSNKIEKYKNSQSKVAKFENYINTRISPLQKNLS